MVTRSLVFVLRNVFVPVGEGFFVFQNLLGVKLMIKIKNLTKKFKSSSGDITVLNNINLNIEKGDIFGIIGVSGAGKSTLLRCIAMLETPTHGSIEIDGCDISSKNAKQNHSLRRKIGVIAQSYNLLMQRTVIKNVAFPLELAGVPKEERLKRARRMLEVVGLSDKENSYPSQLSGGQKQRVAIARALAVNPPVLLCDEPTSALDSMTTRAILELLQDINKKFNITIIMITHNMDVVKQICSKVAVIDKSKIVEYGLTKDVVKCPQNIVTSNLLGDALKKEAC